ncbi:MAG: hypothetical protein JRN59_08775, partial [Nitrososphaerota archaeon]|nr:hypothetical protein [Nitrososphaerota archaeon]
MRLSRAKGDSKEAVEEVPFTAVDGLSTFLKQKGNTLLVKGYAGAGNEAHDGGDHAHLQGEGDRVVEVPHRVVREADIG